MRAPNRLLALVFVAFVSAMIVPADATASGSVSVAVFHEHLTPYGRWVVAGSAGNVWVPRVATGWAPYVDGQWAYTDYGWTWVSADPWGDVPCHYGAWAWVDPYGWVWTPGTVWAPAWVTWAYTDDYIGWAPVPPTFALSVTGYVGAPIVVAQSRYCFVPTRQFVGVPVATVRLPAQRNATIFPHAVMTTRYQVSGGIVRASGPPPSRIEQVTSRKVETVSIDRVKARPTTLADAGVSRGGSVRAALPAAERRSLDGKSASAGQPEVKAKTASGHGTAATTTSNHGTSHGSSGQPETHVAAKHGTAATTSPAPKAKAPKPAASPESHVAEKPGKAKAPKPVDSPKQKQVPPPAVVDHESPGKSGPSEETHVASHSTAPSAHGHPPQVQKAKPPEKKPQPPAEKPQ